MSFSKVGLLEALARVPDFRQAQGQRHALSAILASVICGVLAGQPGVKQIVQWLHAQPVEFWHLLGYTRRPPQETWFRKVLAKLDPEQWEAVVVGWLGEEGGSPSEVANPVSGPAWAEKSVAPATELDVVSVDGKTLRGTISKHLKTLHLLTMWAHASGLVLWQKEVADTNEPKTAVEMFRGMLLTGKLVVADAIFCQREVCQTIREGEGHYLLWVKDNQPTLLKDARSVFHDPAGFSPLQQTAS